MTYFWMFLCLMLEVIVLNVGNIRADHPLINTTVGLIRGRKADDGNYWKYQGIPYAKVNKSNPFGDSLPYPRFESTFEAYDDTAICPQIEEFNSTYVGDLDCLHLNIYVPELSYEFSKIPVLVYIHGGNFAFGFSGTYMYGPKFLVRNGIIFVTLNFRVGPYGFLNTDIPQIAGNQGVKDQIKALRWIQRNIYYFGGDPDKITINGNSFGASCLDIIMRTVNKNEKLFDKVILQSLYSYRLGNGIGKPDNRTLIALGKYFNLNSSNLNDVVKDLAQINSSSIIKASVALNMTYMFCLENLYEGVQNFLVEYPLNLDYPTMKNMPILIGNVNNEFEIYYLDMTLKIIETRDVFQRAINFFDFHKDYARNMKLLMRRFYIKDERNVTKESIKTFFDDFFFLYPSRRKILKYIEDGAKRVYYYMFSYSGKRNFAQILNNFTDPGAVHADDIGYLFDMTFLDKNISKDDMLVIDRLTTMWANFVKYGDPTPTTTNLIPVKWEPYTEQKQKYFLIDRDLKLKSKPLQQRMAFWDLFYSINEKYQVGYREN